MKVLILGATGGTGRQIVRVAGARGHAVVALVRSKDKAQDLAGAQLMEGDARDDDSLSRALEGCAGVISSLGTALRPFREVTLLSTATRSLVTAMKRQSVRRLVCITGVGAGDSRGHGGFFYDTVFLPLFLRQV
jgi:putative NADH-flavin reductase